MSDFGGTAGHKRLDIGSHRSMTVEETLENLKPHLAAFGVTRVANVTGLDRIGIPVTLAIRPNSKSVAVSQGKGPTLGHAKASALMETVEIWHAENFDKPVYYGKLRDLRARHRMIDTQRLPDIPWNSFDEVTPTLWVEGKDLINDERLLVPYEMIHCDYTRPVQPAHGHFPASTNGLASGNSVLEAQCHALAEVIERDALSLWHVTGADQKASRRIDPATIQYDEVQELLAKVERAGLIPGFWDITTDISVATILCLIHDPTSQMGHIGLGSGTHVDGMVALRRALTEAAQTRLNYISGARDDLNLGEFESAGISGKQTFVEEMFATGEPRKSIDDVHSLTLPTLQEDLGHMRTCLQGAGIDEIACCDLTREEFGIPVVRVIVPGLEAPHDDDGYLAGPRAKAVVGQ